MRILLDNSNFIYVNVNLMGVYNQYFPEATAEALQILPDKVTNFIKETCHWITLYYDDHFIHIYDSLNRNNVTSEQKCS